MPQVVTRESPHRLRWIQTRLAYLVLLAFMAFFAYTFLQKSREIKGLAQQEAALRAANAQLSADNARVTKNIAYYRTLAYVEERARSDLGWSKPGEVIVQASPRWQPAPVVQRAPTRRPLPPQPVWQQWLDVFLK